MTVVDLPAIRDAGQTILDWANQPPHGIPRDWHSIAHALRALETLADMPTRLGAVTRILTQPSDDTTGPDTCEALRSLARGLRLPLPAQLEHAEQLALPLDQ